jgi:hypothetical protein
VIAAVHVARDPRSVPCERCRERTATYRADGAAGRHWLCTTCTALTALEWERPRRGAA